MSATQGHDPRDSHAEDGFPFSAVVGQDDYKLALLANAVDPSIGGVLAAGERGTAKSTLARAFANVIPAAETSTSAFVELPLGASLDRLTGSIDTGKLLAGEGAHVSHGLLAEADKGILYVDEVNLLGDHLVDVVLDAAAFGVVRTEREGISATSPARFVLVGTMNPEEGSLRPQLLDRFGLGVRIESAQSIDQRTEIVGRRIEFERDRAAFAARFAPTETALREIVARARTGLADVDLTSDCLDLIATACQRLGVEGVRADLATARTARALAALDQRKSVIVRDVETAARLALPHRAATSIGDDWIAAAEIRRALAGSEREGGAAHESVPRPRTAAGAMPRPEADSGVAAQANDIAASLPNSAEHSEGFAGFTHDLASAEGEHTSGKLGRGARAVGGERPAVDATPSPIPTDLDVIATARAAVTRRLFNGSADHTSVGAIDTSDPIHAKPGDIRAGDLRDRVRSGREANLVLCVVDASSSVLDSGRDGELRALLGGLASDARRRRDRVGLIVFRGRDARLVAPPSRNHAAVLAGLDTIEPGGTTPLAEGIRVAHETALRELRRNPDLRPIVALVTDGYANVARSGDALSEARFAAKELRRDGVTMVVIGETSSGAPQFAQATGAEFYPFDRPQSGTSRQDAA
ncbi:MAG: VWA domain-containing protein [Solirubrobacterales bacterium]